MSVLCVAIFWVVNASSGEKSCLQISIPTGSGEGGEGGVSHRLNVNLILYVLVCVCGMYVWNVQATIFGSRVRLC